jgi:formylmethanofuran dehydrogenase subunit C
VSGIEVRLRAPLAAPADCSALLAGEWTTLAAGELARRGVRIDGRTVPLGELCDVAGAPDGTLRFTGDWSRAARLGARLAEGALRVESDVGDEVGLGMAGGSIEVRGAAGARAGAAPAEARRGMTGGELVIHGPAGPEAGALMRRGLVAVGGAVGDHAGVGMIAGTIVVFGPVGPAPGLWSKRGSLVAMGDVGIPSTYRYACTYRPPHVPLILMRLAARHGLRAEARHLTGSYRRYSGDLAELGKGEILAWTAS